MGVLRRTYVRPGPSRCGNPPPPGTTITARAHAGIQACYDSALASGGLIKISGVFGDDSHMLGCGGHTAHEPGSPVGVAHAIDLDNAVPPPPGKMTLGQFAIWYCRTDADTSQLRFMNYDGSQYNYAGQRVAGSSDEHLHWHRRPGGEHVLLNIVALYLDYLDAEDDMDATQAAQLKKVHDILTGVEPVLSWSPDITLASGGYLTEGKAEKLPRVLQLITLHAHGGRGDVGKLAASEAAEDAAELARDAAQDQLIITLPTADVDVEELADALENTLGTDLVASLTGVLDNRLSRTRLTVEPEPAPE